MEILFASTCAGYMDDASTADTYLSNPGLKHITSPPTLVRSSYDTEYGGTTSRSGNPYNIV